MSITNIASFPPMSLDSTSGIVAHGEDITSFPPQGLDDSITPIIDIRLELILLALCIMFFVYSVNQYSKPATRPTPTPVPALAPAHVEYTYNGPCEIHNHYVKADENRDRQPREEQGNGRRQGERARGQVPATEVGSEQGVSATRQSSRSSENRG